MNCYATYSDSRYVVRLLAMYKSLRRWCGHSVRLFVLCLDDATYAILGRMSLPGITLIPLAEMEDGDSALLAAKLTRSRIEYYFTCTPSLSLYVLRRFGDVDAVTYLDADLYFYASPEALFEEGGTCSIIIVPHRYSSRWLKYADRGRYNVSFITFRRDFNALACLQWWRERCLEWCEDRLDGDRYADQKYLDRWPEMFGGVHVLQNRGANVAPWNIEDVTVSGRKRDLRVDGVPLIFYHFEGYCQETEHLIDPGLVRHGYRLPAKVVRGIHLPYVDALLESRRLLARHGFDVSRFRGNTRLLDGSPPPSLTWWYTLRCFLEGQYVWCFMGRGLYLDSRLMRRSCGWLQRLARAVAGASIRGGQR